MPSDQLAALVADDAEERITGVEHHALRRELDPALHLFDGLALGSRGGAAADSQQRR
jgi:hypothetical protein